MDTWWRCSEHQTRFKGHRRSVRVYIWRWYVCVCCSLVVWSWFKLTATCWSTVMPVILHCGPRMVAPFGSAWRGPKPSKWTWGGGGGHFQSRFLWIVWSLLVCPDGLVELALQQGWPPSQVLLIFWSPTRFQSADVAPVDIRRSRLGQVMEPRLQAWGRCFCSVFLTNADNFSDCWCIPVLDVWEGALCGGH